MNIIKPQGVQKPTWEHISRLRDRANVTTHHYNIEDDRFVKTVREKSRMSDNLKPISMIGGPLLGAAVGAFHTGGFSLPWVATGIAGGLIGAYLRDNITSAIIPSVGESYPKSIVAARTALAEYRDALLARADDPELTEGTWSGIWHTGMFHEKLSEQWPAAENLHKVVANREASGWEGELANASHIPEIHSYLYKDIAKSGAPEKFTQMLVDGITAGELDQEVAEQVSDAISEYKRAKNRP